MKDSRLCAGDDIMMRWPEIRGFSWPEHAKMDLWPGIGRFLWPEKSPVKLRLTSYELEDGVMNRRCQYGESVVMTV